MPRSTLSPTVRWFVGPFFLCCFLPVSAMAQELGVVVEEQKEQPTQSSFWDNFYYHLDVSARTGYTFTELSNYPFRTLGVVEASVGYDVTDWLTLQASGIGSLPILVGFDPAKVAPVEHLGVVDLGDSFVKAKWDDWSLSLGYLRVPWRNLRVFSLNDRLNPIDYRLGYNFRTTLGRMPQWGNELHGSLAGFEIDGVFFWNYTQPAGGVIATKQGGVTPGHYQGAFFASPICRSKLRLNQAATVAWFTAPTLGLSVKKNLGDIDVSVNAVWGHDELPSFAPTLLTDLDLAQLSYARSLSFGASLSYALGILILKAEVLAEPRMGEAFGKTIWLAKDNQIASQQVSSAALAVGVDGEYGDYFSGSLEIMDRGYFGVAGDKWLLGVEGHGTASPNRFVNRLALGMHVTGSALEKNLQWLFRGEIGLMNPDILMGIQVFHEWPDLGLYAGIYSDVFSGVFNSPGGFRQEQTALGVELGYRR